MLDNRLKKCAELVSGRGIVVDVGTDHAYLAAELVLSGKCGRIIASDINDGPLDSARKTVEKYGVADNVDLILSDGLENVPLDGVSDIVIAGMGGETIADIIENADISGSTNLILQPMTKVDVLRKRLAEMGFEIDSEMLVEDGERIYVIICTHFEGFKTRITEFSSLFGAFDERDPLTAKYRSKEADRLEKIAVSLEKSGKINESVHYRSLSKRMMNGTKREDICEIYSYLDEKIPFSTQEKWDNSGLLVENGDMECERVLLTLDITHSAIYEATEYDAELIISHHPVIFDPLRIIGRQSTVSSLISNEIAAICMHTNLDISPLGTNGAILRRLSEKVRIAGDPHPFEELGGGSSLGYIVELDERTTVDKFSETLKEIFGCPYLRVNTDRKNKISKIAICSGSGGSMLDLAIEKGCDALVTGDIKHDVWISANSSRTALFDCGHFYTENLVLPELRRILEEKFPLLDVEIAESSVDPCCYI